MSDLFIVIGGRPVRVIEAPGIDHDWFLNATDWVLGNRPETPSEAFERRVMGAAAKFNEATLKDAPQVIW